jgi:hypothetical protein
LLGQWEAVVSRARAGGGRYTRQWPARVVMFTIAVRVAGSVACVTVHRVVVAGLIRTVVL